METGCHRAINYDGENRAFIARFRNPTQRVSIRFVGDKSTQLPLHQNSESNIPKYVHNNQTSFEVEVRYSGTWLE